MYSISFVLMFYSYIVVRQGSKYQDGKLVGADYETEITEWYSGDRNGNIANEYDESKGSNILAITDESKHSKSSANHMNNIFLLFTSCLAVIM